MNYPEVESTVQYSTVQYDVKNVTEGRDVALDVTVTNSLQAATVTRAATTPGHAANEAHERKIRETVEECRQQGIVFVPLAAESLGGWHPVAVMELKRLASALARQTGQEESETVSHMFQRLAVILQRGNSAMLSNRVPSHASPQTSGVE